jgi:hypothetical protein
MQEYVFLNWKLSVSFVNLCSIQRIAEKPEEVYIPTKNKNKCLNLFKTKELYVFILDFV